MSKPLLIITIPCLPPSYNSMYSVVYSQRKVVLRAEARRWQQTATAFMPPCSEFADDGLYEVEIYYHGKWFDGKKQLKNKDSRNYEKLITDTVFARYGVNDKRIWKSVVEKVEDEEEKVVYKVFRQ